MPSHGAARFRKTRYAVDVNGASAPALLLWPPPGSFYLPVTPPSRPPGPPPPPRSRHRHRRLLIRLRSVVKTDQSGPARHGFASMDGRTVARWSVLQFSGSFFPAFGGIQGVQNYVYPQQPGGTVNAYAGNRAANDHYRHTGRNRHDDTITRSSSNRCLAPRPTRHARLWTGRRAAFRCLTETSSSNTRNRSQWHSLESVFPLQ